jgi:hypothetical protein
MGPAQVPVAPKKSTGKTLAIVGGVIASIVVILMVAASFAQPDNVITGPTASPSAVVTPEPSPEPSPGPSTPTTPKAGECSSELTSRQCRLAKDVGAFYILLESCVPNPDYADAVVCDPAGADAIKGDPTVYLFRETSRADLDKDIDQFFKHVNVKPGGDWLNPPAKTTWFYRTDPDTTIGTLASANDKADNQGRVAWTFNKELIYAEIASAGGDAKNLIEWWSR